MASRTYHPCAKELPEQVSNLRFLCLLTATLLVVVVPAGVSAQLITQVVTTPAGSPAIFSPDGDGANETFRVTVTLTESTPAITVSVLASDSTSTITTLFAGAAASGVNAFTWDGTDGVSTVPDGKYVVSVQANGTTQPDTTVLRDVYVDTIAPSITLSGPFPPVYTPDAPSQLPTAQISINVAGSTAPGALPVGDQISLELFNPSNSLLADALELQPDFAGDGAYTAVWDARGVASLQDGMHRARITIADNAQHSNIDSMIIDLNKRGPEATYLNLDDDETVTSLPDSLRGYVFDRHGVDSLHVRYSTTAPFTPVTSTQTRGDTLYFAVVLADSVPGDGSVTITLRARDGFGLERNNNFDATLDSQPPTAPTIDPFPTSTWNADSIAVSFSWSDTPEYIRVYVNGTQVDSVVTILRSRATTDVELAPGSNTVFVTAIDEAKNESVPSATNTIVYDDGVGVALPNPFRPGDEFQVSTGTNVNSVRLRLYDMAGDLVLVLEDNSPRSSFRFRWNGTNGDGDEVRKGPLMLVVEIVDTGRIFKELFLYAP